VILILIVVIIIAANHGHGSSASGRTAQNAPTGSAASLPQTASTAFNATPTYNGTGDTFSGAITDSNNNSLVHMNLTPSLNGFDLDIGVSAQYTAAGASGADGEGVSGSSVLGDFSNNCLQIAIPGQQGSSYTEFPLANRLSASGNSVSGSVVYSAVMPGVYSFGLQEDGGCGGTDIGSITTPNLGNSPGSDSGSGAVVFSESTSSTDTVLSFGETGSSQDQPSQIQTSCIAGSDLGPGNPVTKTPTNVQFTQHQSGNGTWYSVGTMTFDLPDSWLTANKNSGDLYYYGCAVDQGGAVSLHP
jgi:hypothetical protein